MCQWEQGTAVGHRVRLGMLRALSFPPCNVTRGLHSANKLRGWCCVAIGLGLQEDRLLAAELSNILCNQACAAPLPNLQVGLQHRLMSAGRTACQNSFNHKSCCSIPMCIYKAHLVYSFFFEVLANLQFMHVS